MNKVLESYLREQNLDDWIYESEAIVGAVGACFGETAKEVWDKLNSGPSPEVEIMDAIYHVFAPKSKACWDNATSKQSTRPECDQNRLEQEAVDMAKHFCILTKKNNQAKGEHDA